MTKTFSFGGAKYVIYDKIIVKYPIFISLFQDGMH